MPSLMACRSKIFCNSAFNAFGNVVRRLWVGAGNIDWLSAIDPVIGASSSYPPKARDASAWRQWKSSIDSVIHMHYN